MFAQQSCIQGPNGPISAAFSRKHCTLRREHVTRISLDLRQELTIGSLITCLETTYGQRRGRLLPRLSPGHAAAFDLPSYPLMSPLPLAVVSHLLLSSQLDAWFSLVASSRRSKLRRPSQSTRTCSRILPSAACINANCCHLEVVPREGVDILETLRSDGPRLSQH